HFLYFVRAGQSERSGIYLSASASKGRKRLLGNNTNALYAPAYKGNPGGSGSPQSISRGLSARRPQLQKQIGSHVEELAQRPGLGSADSAFAIEDLGCYPTRPEDAQQIPLSQPSFLHQVLQPAKRRRGVQGVVLFFEIFDQ